VAAYTVCLLVLLLFRPGMFILGRHYTNRNKRFINCFYDKKLQRVYPRKAKPVNFERVFFDLAEINAEIW